MRTCGRKAIEFLTNAVLMIFLTIMAIGIARLNNLFAAVLLTGIFSLLSAAIFVVLDAVDVAFTEAAVGAGITTVLMLATLSRTVSRQKRGETSAGRSAVRERRVRSDAVDRIFRLAADGQRPVAGSATCLATIYRGVAR